MTSEMLESAKGGYIDVELTGTWNEGEFYIDDIVVTPAE